MKDGRNIIKAMQVTEKGTHLAAKGNQYLFSVDRSANKIDIKRAVEAAFQVHVEKVNTMNRHGKRKRERTLRFGRTPGWKRAVVTLRQGETIEAG
jgi:large subunit ribosomal protein L23